jgi:hypothetical protein
MLVQVRWTNNRFDYVKDFLLDHLIEAGVVASFLRLSGWVTIGVDQVRSSDPKCIYNGVEKRALNQSPSVGQSVHLSQQRPELPKE